MHTRTPTYTRIQLAECGCVRCAPLQVRACCPAGEQAEWWYDVAAVRKVDLQYVPEHLRTHLRPSESLRGGEGGRGGGGGVCCS
jgi:hypothetical protein